MVPQKVTIELVMAPIDLLTAVLISPTNAILGDITSKLSILNLGDFPQYECSPSSEKTCHR